MDLIRDCRFKNSFIFKYSKRDGTRAFEMFEDDIPEDVKRRRNNEMLDLQNAISAEDNAQFIGSSVSVLVEGPSKAALKSGRDSTASDSSLAQQLMGRSECDRIVVFQGNPRLVGSTVDVSVSDCTSTTLIGEIVTAEIQHGPSGLLPVIS